ncbi:MULTISPECIES: hypothetical protein [unclassified Lysobacter]|uniref:hypothetical protein n=1 Tax=unclassified Lysobacter TaxID=2635362 RepID=UPI001BE6391E|nr:MULTISPECIES: hypothetical protein [unclassified Lysobacter]MBT2748012.1 hypothetical protein [Lysobacter sp. ISL-42]MBT2752776.1 hypothetical protein [Lysobacter sp. ISL-50]MBT2779364.1 hypothetical protein [Lysobacter sp. ISL-54]MBT2781920.1 hypothetical protein [Lysobacter sp. ISL-52]
MAANDAAHERTKIREKQRQLKVSLAAHVFIMIFCTDFAINSLNARRERCFADTKFPRKIADTNAADEEWISSARA